MAFVGADSKNGTYSIYFRPDGQGDQNSGWHYGYIYVEDKGVVTGVQTIKGENIENAEWYNLSGQKVNNPQRASPFTAESVANVLTSARAWPSPVR